MGEWYYIENGSLNGTYYNGSKIKANDHGEFDAVKLSNGDILRIDSDSLDYPEERGVFFLFTTEGIGNQWKTVTLNKKEISFGRNEENDITIPLSYVSGKHMVIEDVIMNISLWTAIQWLAPGLMERKFMVRQS